MQIFMLYKRFKLKLGTIFLTMMFNKCMINLNSGKREFKEFYVAI